MTLTKRQLDELLWYMRASNITAEDKTAILMRFGHEPDGGFEWSWQDICEQVRKIACSSDHSPI